jgi:DNA polymerase-3 subunit epsilon
VKKCRGACVGEESPEQHNLRLVTSLAPWRVADWPWPGRIMVMERDPDSGLEEAHVFDRWCHLATVRSEEALEEWASSRAELDFDPDVYKIVQSFVAKHPRAVKPLAAPDHSYLQPSVPARPRILSTQPGAIEGTASD